MYDLEKLFDKQQELLDKVQKKFAEKGETKKALKHLEKEVGNFNGLNIKINQLRNLANLFFSLHNPDGDDSLFAKKPLGGWSCAACEKGLINMQGIPAEYHAWNKMPTRDPADRIARVISYQQIIDYM